jgi:hypothetical protein
MSDNNRNPKEWQTRSVPDAADAMDAAIVHALEQAPVVAVPETFAVRVTARALAEGRQQNSRRGAVGRRAALVSGIVLVLALFAFAPHATPRFSDLRFDMELMLLTELGLVGYVLSRTGLRS